jgi:hypothetical protein
MKAGRPMPINLDELRDYGPRDRGSRLPNAATEAENAALVWLERGGQLAR